MTVSRREPFLQYFHSANHNWPRESSSSVPGRRPAIEVIISELEAVVLRLLNWIRNDGNDDEGINASCERTHLRRTTRRGEAPLVKKSKT